MVSNNHSVEKSRLAVLEKVKEIQQDIEQDVAVRDGRIWKNINNAEYDLLDYAEYNHCVRLALHQMSGLAVTYDAIPPERTERINTLREELEEKAALPPQDQITR